MKYDSRGKRTIRSRIRELAHLLAYEEEACHKFKGWWSRKAEYDFLLKRLYRLENKV